MRKRSKMVLLVEDDIDDRELFVQAMAKKHPELLCCTVKNGLEALLFLKTNDYLPDYVFLDLNMPVMDGKSCLRRIKQEPQWSHIPVFIYSTSELPEDKIETELLGARSFIKKPLRFTQICKEISALINGLLAEN